VTSRQLLWAASGFMAITLLASCSSRDNPPLAPTASTPASPAPSSTITAEQAAAEKDALAAYNAYMEYLVKAQTTGAFNHDEMARFVGDPLLGNQIFALSNQQQAKVLLQGRPKWAPKVTKIDLVATPHVVTVSDCLDVTGYTAVKDGKPVPPPSGPTRNAVLMHVKLVNGAWYVYEDVAPKGQTC
jgi:hypothetical protein